MALLLASTGAGVLRGAQLGDPRLPEHEQKANLIYFVAKYTIWPEAALKETNQPIVLGVLGDDPVGPAIRALSQEGLKNHPVEVVFFRSPKEVAACHLLFVAGKEGKVSSELIEKCASDHVLTFGESEDFESQGGMLTFFKEGNLVKALLNQEALKAAGLDMSPKLIQLLRQNKAGSRR